MLIIGLSGTNGSGKDTVAEMLVERHGFFSATATEMLADELRKREWPIDRKHKAKLSTEWRTLEGMGAVVDHGLARLEETGDESYKGFVVSSLRHPGEADRIHELGGKVLWVDADPSIRYERVINSLRGADKASEDRKTYEEFTKEQEAEMHRSDDPASLGISEVKDRADIFLENNSDDIEAFKNAAEKALNL